MVEIKQLSGVLNSDDANEVIGATHHKYAKNIRFRGMVNNLRAESVLGTILLNNPYLPTGSNECIGAFFDELHGKIFSFNYNSNGNHAIYQYDLATKLFTRILQVGYNTDGNILNFTLNGKIYAVKMLYGDTIQGDTIYFNNSQKEPCEVNIKTAIDGTYATIKRSYINVIKAPFLFDIGATYTNDNTVTVNNLRKKLFKFAIRYVYRSREKSVYSSTSILALPINYNATDVDKDPTKNSRIDLAFPTGEADVVKIEVIGYVSGKSDENGIVDPNTFSEPFLIKSLIKSDEGIADNDVYTFRFFNDQAYIPLDAEEAIQLFDLVPLQANALEFLNGNVPIYGAILEGYNQTKITGSTTSTSEPEQTTQPPFSFGAYQSGSKGFGTGNIHFYLLGAVVIGDSITIKTTNQTLTFAATVATTANIISGLLALATTAGFTIVLSDNENLVISKTGESLLLCTAAPVLRAVSDSFVYDRNSRYNFVIIYEDDNGRSIGAQTTNGLNVQTINYTESTGTPNIPKIQLSITNRPPIYAKTFKVGRTKNLSKLTKLEWVSFITAKDSQYAYISIENLNDFIKTNPSSSFLAYDFSAGDRIRFYKVLSGSVNTIYTDKDFEIQSQVINPTINGIIQQGQFVKIYLPTTSGTFDFGTAAFYNYFIELYTPAQSTAEGLDLDYEFGESYAIGDWGTANAYHQGMLQNQSADLVTPATFEFTQGDYYYRKRNISAGNAVEWSFTEQASLGGASFYPALNLVRSTIDATAFSVQSTAAFSTLNSSQNANWAMFKNSAPAVRTFTISGGQLRIKSNVDCLQVFMNVALYDGASTYDYTAIVTLNNVIANTEYVVDLTGLLTFKATYQRLYFNFSARQTPTITGFNGIVSGNIILNESDKTYNIGVIDPNFSDVFESKVNSNGRAWEVDPNAAQVFNPTLMRWGLAYEPNTNINQTNRFKPLNFDEADRSNGQIQVFKTRGDRLRIFFERRCGVAGIYSKFLETNGGGSVVTTTNDIITKNNVQYYSGTFGIGNQPTGLVSSKEADYFIDPIRAYQLRLSGDGIQPISELYKGQYYIQPLFVPYTMDYLRPNGAIAKILGYYDYAEEQYVSILQGGTLNGKGINNYAFSFNEKRNAYCSFYDFTPEWILSANDVTYSWKNGQMYVHNKEGNGWCEFYGQSFNPEITLVFNKDVAIRKKYMGMGYQSNQKFCSPIIGDINTSTINPQTGLRQESQLLERDFVLEESVYTAGLLFDANSRQDQKQGLLNGDFLGGNFAECRFIYRGNEYSYLYLPYVTAIPSNRNF